MYTCDFVRVCAFERACVHDFCMPVCIKLYVFFGEEIYQNK